MLSDIDDAYREIRRRISGRMNRVRAIALRHDVGHDFTIVLRQRGAPRQRQNIEDGLNRTIGALQDEVAAERRHIRNPLWWLLYGPFVLLRSAGVETSGIEDRTWSRLLVRVVFDVIAGLIVATAVFVLRAVGLD